MFDKMVVTKNENDNTYKIQIKGLTYKDNPEVRYNVVIPRSTEPNVNFNNHEEKGLFSFSRSTNMKIETQLLVAEEGLIFQVRKLRKRKIK